MSQDNQKSRAQARQTAPRQGPFSFWPVIVAVAIVAGAVWLLFAHLNASTAVGPSPAPSVYPSQHIPSQGHQGHAPGDTKRFAHFQYSSDPPTSGFHLEVMSHAFINEAPLPKYVQVHLLEHGNILLQYNCLCPDTVNALSAIANEYNSRLLPPGVTTPTMDQIRNAEENGLAVVVAPYPSMTHPIALTAWTRLAYMDTVNKADVISFINRWLRDPDNLQQ